MITRTKKASAAVLADLAAFVTEEGPYFKEHFPQCSNNQELVLELKKSARAWNVLVTNQAAALFTLDIMDTTAVLGRFLPSRHASLDALISDVRRDFERIKIETLAARVPEEKAAAFANCGFERRRLLVRLTGPVIETKLMPILPLSNPSEREIPILANLMFESYGKSTELKMANVAFAEKVMRSIMTGLRGPYVSEGSHMSGAVRNIVSACLVTLNSPRQAEVTELFTHPLYRARGLASTEVAIGMNKLLRRGIQTMTAWVAESNEIARRLFMKLGFKEDARSVEMVAKLQ